MDLDSRGSTSVADVCMIPVQDVLVLGSEARMNTPADSGE